MFRVSAEAALRAGVYKAAACATVQTGWYYVANGSDSTTSRGRLGVVRLLVRNRLPRIFARLRPKTYGNQSVRES